MAAAAVVARARAKIHASVGSVSVNLTATESSAEVMAAAAVAAPALAISRALMTNASVRPNVTESSAVLMVVVEAVVRVEATMLASMTSVSASLAVTERYAAETDVAAAAVVAQTERSARLLGHHVIVQRPVRQVRLFVRVPWQFSIAFSLKANALAGRPCNALVAAHLAHPTRHVTLAFSHRKPADQLKTPARLRACNMSGPIGWKKSLREPLIGHSMT